MTPRRTSFLFAVILVGAAARASAVPALPIITQPATDGQIVNPADVHMEAPAYSDSNDPPSPHAASDWEIWDTDLGERAWYRLGVTDPVLMVHIHLGDGTFDNSYAGHTQLNYDTHYYVRAGFWNQSGEHSDWSQRFFRTSPQGPAGVPGPMPWVVFQPGFSVEIVATGFQLPVNIAFVPNPGPNPTDPFVYVAELYGNIKVMLRNGTVADYATGLLNFNPTGIFPGSGEQGLAGIVVEPATGDVFASMLYEDTSSNQDPKPHYAKVIRLHSADGGHTAAGQTLVLDLAFSNSVPQPFGASHQISNLTIGPDGKLYIHTGDGDSGTAMDTDSFRGKILRANLDGTAPPDNPFYNAGDGISAQDYVFAYGFRNPFGGDWREADGYHYEIENGPDVDRFAKVVSGRNYLWDGSDASMYNYALYNWGPPAHAPVNIAFVQPGTFTGSGFPFAKRDHAYVTESGPTWASGPQVLGKRIVEFSFDENGNAIGPTTLVEYNGIGRATAVGIAAGPDGLYFTDLYKDEDTDPPNPIAPGANLLRIGYNVTPQADLAITGMEGPVDPVPGAPVSYTIQSTNLGPSAVSGATVTIGAPQGVVAPTWTCTGAGGGTCGASGSGSINDKADLPAGATVTYTLSGTVGPSASKLGTVATITTPSTVVDPNPRNNTAILRRPDRLPAQSSAPGGPGAIGNQPAPSDPGPPGPGVASLSEAAPKTVPRAAPKGAAARSPLAWSTVGSRATSYSFSNRTAAPVSGTLTLVDATGVVLSVFTMSIPALQEVDVDTASLGIDRNRTGTARFSHDGPPDAVGVETTVDVDAPPADPPFESPPRKR